MFQNMRLVIFFDIFLNPSFKMTASVTNIARTTGITNKFIYYDFKSLRIRSLYEKYILVLNELKTSLLLKFLHQTLKKFNPNSLKVYF